MRCLVTGATAMMQRYARVAGLRRRVIVPTRVLSPGLTAYWVGLVTPVPNSIARPLVAGVVHEAVAADASIRSLVPSVHPIGFDEAVRLALGKIRNADVETRLSNAAGRDAAAQPLPTSGLPAGRDAAAQPQPQPTSRLPAGRDAAAQPLPTSGLPAGRDAAAQPQPTSGLPAGRDAAAEPLPSDPDWSGGSVYVDERSRRVDAPVEALWRVIEGVGGENGWYSFPLAWSVRGWLDRLVGGVGLRRGRRDRHRLRVGEALDWWRVEEIVPGSLLRLRAEMRVPGRAWLEMSAAASPDGSSVYRQRAVFLPRGLAGHAYWAAVLPFHGVVFSGMARNIAARASASI